MKTTIQFEAVGRERRTWVQTFDELPDGDDGLDIIAAAAKRGGRLMSNNVEAGWDPTGAHGAIFAGWQKVGSFHVVAETDRPVVGLVGR